MDESNKECDIKSCPQYILIREFDLTRYARMNFGMFGGEEVTVKLRFKDEIMAVLIDRFGKGIPVSPAGREEWSETSVDVALSNQFLGWIFSFGARVRIAGPKAVADRFKNEIKSIEELYGI